MSSSKKIYISTSTNKSVVLMLFIVCLFFAIVLIMNKKKFFSLVYPSTYNTASISIKEYNQPCKTEEELGENKWRFVSEGRKMLAVSGFSSSYIDEHFCVTAIEGGYPNDKQARVVWKYVVGEYKLMHDTFVGNSYNRAHRYHDYIKILSRSEALNKMRNCLGNQYDNARPSLAPYWDGKEENWGLTLRAYYSDPNSNLIKDATLNLETGKCVLNEGVAVR